MKDEDSVIIYSLIVLFQSVLYVGARKEIIWRMFMQLLVFCVQWQFKVAMNVIQKYLRIDM